MSKEEIDTWQEMYDSINNPDKIDEAKRLRQIEERQKNKKADTGL